MRLHTSPWTRVTTFNICGTTWSSPTSIIVAKSYKDIVAFLSSCLCVFVIIGCSKGNDCMGLQSSYNSNQFAIL
jgi:hypothetical protein